MTDALIPEIETDKLGDLPEGVREFYAPVEGKDGVSRLQVTRVNGLALEDVSGLERTLADRKEKHQKVSARMSLVETALGDDLTVDDLAAALTDYRKWKSTPPGSGGGKGLSDEEVQRRVTEALGGKEKAWGEERSKLTGERDGAVGDLSTYLRTSAAQAAISKAKGNVELLLPHVLPMIQAVIGEDGRQQAVVVDGKGRPREVVKDGILVPVDLVDFINEHFKKSEAFGSAFAGANVAGSGSRTSTTGGGPTGRNPFSKSAFNLTEISRLARENPTEAKRLKAAAVQSGDLHKAAAKMLSDR
ncbi:MAG: hypothetical protein DRH08_00920 [Deltaproteobacteria bacterium]|nr:MAG: hypothetical protein DRH08_00920 [Deltaproteobacteria bacterium]